jgi:hypothetical protein
MSEAFKETVADIALTAGYMLALGQISCGDSRELVSNIIIWAEEFIRDHEKKDWDSEDYIEKVDEFAVQKLEEAYGTRT